MELADVSRQDVPAKVLAEQIISNPGRSPIPFELSYDPDAIVPNHSYAVQARIEWEGKLRFINDTRHCAITRGCPKHRQRGGSAGATLMNGEEPRAGANARPRTRGSVYGHAPADHDQQDQARCQEHIGLRLGDRLGDRAGKGARR